MPRSSSVSQSNRPSVRLRFRCPLSTCPRLLRSKSGWTQHILSAHPDRYPSYIQSLNAVVGIPEQFIPIQSNRELYSSPPATPRQEIPSPVALHWQDPLPDIESLRLSPLLSLEEGDALTIYPTEYHTVINGTLRRLPRLLHADLFDSGKPYDQNGITVTESGEGAQPPPDSGFPDDWAPFKDRLAFRTANTFFKNKFSATKIDEILELWAESLEPHSDNPPFLNHQGLYETIDSISLGTVPWQSSSFSYNDPNAIISPDSPKWMTADYTIWYRDPRQLFLNILQNPDFANAFDYAPLREYDQDGNRQYRNFMSGDWAWKQAVCKSYDYQLGSRY